MIAPSWWKMPTPSRADTHRIGAAQISNMYSYFPTKRSRHVRTNFCLARFFPKYYLGVEAVPDFRVQPLPCACQRSCPSGGLTSPHFQSPTYHKIPRIRPPFDAHAKNGGGLIREDLTFGIKMSICQRQCLGCVGRWEVRDHPKFGLTRNETYTKDTFLLRWKALRAPM